METEVVKPESLRVRSTFDGIHLTGSILWFDSHMRGELSFLSSAASPVKSHVPQVIATEETIKILDACRKETNALVCQYNRPFSIGRLKLELLPSGSMLGGSSIFVETMKGRFLYAPTLQPNRIPIVRQMQLKRAQTLITGTYHSDPNVVMPSRKKEREKLIATVRGYIQQKVFPTIYCNPIGTAQEITHLLSENGVPVSVHSSIFRINKIYETYGSNLGAYSHHSKRSPKERVVIMPFLEKMATFPRRRIPEGPIIYIEESMAKTTDPTMIRPVTDRFYFSSTCDGKELREIIAAVDPKEVLIFGPYARRYVDELKDIGPKVKALYPDDHPTLL